MELLNVSSDAPFTYVSGGRFISGRPWTHRERSLDTFVLIFGQVGTLHIQQGERPYEVGPGDALLLLPHVRHFGCRVCEPPLSYFWCHFRCRGDYTIERAEHTLAGRAAAGTGTAEEESGADFINRTRRLLMPVCYHYADADCAVILLNQLLSITGRKQYVHDSASAFLNLVMAELSKEYLCQALHSLHTGRTRRFFEIAEWIRANLDKSLTVADISDRYNYNPNYLSRLFKSNTGMNLKEFIRNLKLEKSKVLLLNTDMSVKQIAFSLGFEDEKYFMRLFKSCVNVTPTQYRNLFPCTHLNNH